MEEEKLPPKWQGVLALIFIWSLIIGCMGYAIYYKWNHPDPYADIEHR